MGEPTPKKKRQRMEPIQTDLFVADIADWPTKDDLHSMEYPIFALTSGDTAIREYTNRTTGRKIRVIPSLIGAATVFDKDILIFAASQIVEGHRQGKPISRTISIDVHTFLLSTFRSTGGNAYAYIIDTLRRLKGTTLETDIPTGGKSRTKGFGLIDGYDILKKTKNESISELSITLSEWFYEAILNYEILTLSKKYFLLDKSLERRFYELAKKHTGDKAYWKIGIDLLQEKSGSRIDKYNFKSEVKRIIKRDGLPEFHVGLNVGKKPNQVVFYTRDTAHLSRELIHDTDAMTWFPAMLKHDTKEGKNS